MTVNYHVVVAVQGAELANRLRASRFQVDEVETGADVLRRTSERADLVIVEGDLPDVSGPDLCRRLKSDPATSGIPILQLLADGGQAAGEGFDGYLEPPVEPFGLAALLGKLLRDSRQSERDLLMRVDQLQAGFDALEDGVGMLAVDGTILHCNPSLAGLLGIPHESARGKDYLSLTVSWPIKRWERPFTRALATGRRQSGDWMIRERAYRISATPVSGPDGRTTCVVMHLSDETDRRRLHERITEVESARLATEARIAQLEREARFLQQLRPLGPEDELSSPDRRLRHKHPATFEQCVQDYERLIDMALEQRSYQVSHQAEISGRLRAMAERLGTLGSTPRDVIEVHGEALKRGTHRQAAQRAHAVTEESRLLVLELMGHLAAYYRTLARCARRGPPSGGAVSEDDRNEAMG